MPNQSRFLALILRHRPETIDLELDTNGWVRIDDLLKAMRRYGRPMSRAELERVVSADRKGRFTLSADATRIRAAQGHSIELDLGLPPSIPPDTLYHGTARHHLNAIFGRGLHPARRQFVHLSRDFEAARSVGSRHGKAVVLSVDCAAMNAQGHVFFRADNGVWMTATVPARFIGFAPN
ncbi:RNA 2'-phosphotransferase [Sedimentitalea arenosa]|uniref:Probable RNA 2'-phosphotransferase n=1 Tax=Sedimentitalea arenosa TaxID=2798803 RepID=A0A8J7J446_9RHOB|nr:RNA 2'-phosphotransferase [Arenibacterium arenosum]MBJ6373405.1 RNA 2'-phosphotransferase [Arenibacterium arenosum]